LISEKPNAVAKCWSWIAWAFHD